MTKTREITNHNPLSTPNELINVLFYHDISSLASPYPVVFVVPDFYPMNEKDRLNSGKNSDGRSSFEHCPLSRDFPINAVRFMHRLVPAWCKGVFQNYIGLVKPVAALALFRLVIGSGFHCGDVSQYCVYVLISPQKRTVFPLLIPVFLIYSCFFLGRTHQNG